MKRLLISVAFLLFLFYFQPSLASEQFCGYSTYSFCLKDADCQVGGCSGQVCERVGEGTITTCEMKECYNAEKYNLTCQCINFKCQWGYSNKTAFAKPSENLIKTVFSHLVKINPILLLIFGFVLLLVVKVVKLIAILLIILGLILLIFSLF